MIPDFVVRSIGFAAAVAAFNLSGAEIHPPSRPLSEYLGVTHAGGKYSIPTRSTPVDYLNEGVDRITSLGARSVKLWFNDKPVEAYPNFSGLPEFDWPKTGKDKEVQSMAALAKLPFYVSAFERPEISTVFLEAAEFARAWWRDGVSPDEAAAVEGEFRDLTEHLMRRWKGTGKTFILQNWEADNALNLKAHPEAKWQEIVDGFIGYMKARQRGTELGRAGVKDSDVKVWNALEINWNWAAIDRKHVPVPEKWTALNKVVRDGFSRHGLVCDLYSWSCWSAKTPETTGKVLCGMDYMRDRVPAIGPLAPDNIFFGEFGTPEHLFKASGEELHTLASDQAHGAVHAELFGNTWRSGARYAVVWELYCNEPLRGVKFDPKHPVSLTERQLNGHWLVRPPAPPEFPRHSLTQAWSHYSGMVALNLYADDLASLDFVNARSNGWAAASNPESWTGGDVSRMHRTSNANSEHLDYAVRAELRDWNIKAFVHGSGASSRHHLRGKLSPDGRQWSEPFEFAVLDAVALDEKAPDWKRLHLKPCDEVPSGQRFLRIEISGSQEPWAIQIGDVRLIAADGGGKAQ